MFCDSLICLCQNDNNKYDLLSAYDVHGLKAQGARQKS